MNMTLSDKYKFIFVRCQKTASQSLIRVFREYDPKLITQIMSRDLINQKLGTHYDPHHIPGYEIHRILPEDKITNYFKFSITRNPWDRLVSVYHYIYQRSDGSAPPRDFDITFSGWLKKDNGWFGVGLNNFDYIGEVDFIGRFENLQEDFNIVCDKIGIPSQQLPHKNKSEHKHYTEYYDDETREIVAEKYAKDIEYFGYAFEGQLY
jgi:chondroitin 4-sulfotransferase 11